MHLAVESVAFLKSDPAFLLYFEHARFSGSYFTTDRLSPIKTPTPCLFSMFLRFGILSAMLRLHVMNPADVLIFVRQLSQPGAASNVFTGYGANPNIIYEMALFPNRDWIDPFQYVIPTL
jgi:hypothetical protein